MHKNKLLFIIFLLSVSAVFGNGIVFAQAAVEVVPHIIDEKAKAKDILKYDIVIRNDSDRKAGLYPVVNDITSDAGLKDFDRDRLDKTASLARWILISRGVQDIEPGGEISVPLEIQIDANARIGSYHAVIAFVQASNRYEATDKAKTEKHPQVLLNIEVAEDIMEKAQIKSFGPARNIYLKPPVEIAMEIENTGNRDLAPEGSIIIYNRRGEEVGEIEIGQTTLPVGETVSVVKQWPNGTMGKYKAKLFLEYGSSVRKELNDTVFFWIFPYKWLVTVFGITLFLVVLLVIVIFKRTYKPVHKVELSDASEKEAETVIVHKKTRIKVKNAAKK